MTAIEFQGVSKSFHRNTGRLPLRNRRGFGFDRFSSAGFQLERGAGGQGI